MPKPFAYRPEYEVQRSICQYLTLRRIPHSITDAARTFGFDGTIRTKVRRFWPDITGVLPGGRALFVEVKSLTGKTTRGQESMLSDLRKQGALAFVARSASEVEEMFRREGVI